MHLLRGQTTAITFMVDDQQLKAELSSQWSKYQHTIIIGQCLESTSFISSANMNEITTSIKIF